MKRKKNAIDHLHEAMPEVFEDRSARAEKFFGGFHIVPVDSKAGREIDDLMVAMLEEHDKLPHCYGIGANPRTKKFFVVHVTEGDKRSTPINLKEYDTIQEAVADRDARNAELGLTPEDIDRITKGMRS